MSTQKIKVGYIDTGGASANQAIVFDGTNVVWSNVLDYNTGIGANTFTSATIAGANTAVGAGANAFTSATVSGANTIAIAAFDKANTGGGLPAAGNTGNVLTSNGTSWVSQLPADQTKTWTAFTTNDTYTVPEGKTTIRVYAFGGGGNGIANTSAGGVGGAGGGGGGCAYGDIAVTPGTILYCNIAVKNASVTYAGTLMLRANTGNNAINATTRGYGGTAYKDASVTNGGAYTGGNGGSGIGGCGGGGSAASPLGNGYNGGTGSGAGGGGGGIGGAGGAGGGGGAGGAGSDFTGGGAGGAAPNIYIPGIGRSPANLFSDPLLRDATGAGGGFAIYGAVAFGTPGQPGGGGGASITGTSAYGGPGGMFGGGGGAFLGLSSGGSGPSNGGQGGFLGGGGGSANSSGAGNQSIVGTAGNGGLGGGGGGSRGLISPGSGGGAIILIYA